MEGCAIAAARSEAESRCSPSTPTTIRPGAETSTVTSMIPLIADTDLTVYQGDVLAVLPTLTDESVDCVITSPPYWGLRDYGTASWKGGDEGCDHSVGGQVEDNKAPGAITTGQRPGVDASFCRKCGATRQDDQIGLEQTPALYVERIVAVFREIRRVLAPHGTVWLNLGDSYAADHAQKRSAVDELGRSLNTGIHAGIPGSKAVESRGTPSGLKAKDLVGIPWRVAFALQADGWWLRSDIIWAKPNPMPDSAKDRPTSSHEHIFLLAKNARYYYDQEAIKEPAVYERWGHQNGPGKYEGANSSGTMIGSLSKQQIQDKWGGKRNKRDVWQVVTEGYPEAHFATFPTKLIEPCVLAGCPQQVCRTCGVPQTRIVEMEKTFESGSGKAGNMPKGKQDLSASETNSTPDVRLGPVVSTRTVGWSDCGHDDYRKGVILDPFAGSGTTGLVARNQQRHAVLIELNEDYIELIATRLQQLSLLA